MFMHLQNPYEETVVLTGSDSTLLATPPNSAYGSTLVSGYETLVISLLIQQHSSVESVKRREYSYEIIKIDGAATGFLKPLYEFPELFALIGKLAEGKPLDETDKANLGELVGATGWDEADLREELTRLGEDPSESIERYKELFEKYSREAVELFSRGDTRQAAEKMWGAVVALVKLYAAIKGVFVAHWSRSKIDSVIASNVEPEYRKLFRELVDRAHVLHEHFYEGSLNEKLFRERWDEMLELLKEAKEVVYKRLPQ